VCCLFSLVGLKLDLYLMASVPRMTNETIPTSGEPVVFPLWKHWSSLHRYFEPSRSHNWIVGMVVFHSGNPKCSEVLWL
jgi:hypothetical protein